MIIVSKQGDWNVTVGGASGTPKLVIPEVVDGSMVQVTCQFEANTGTEGGFYYATKCNQIASARSPAQRSLSGTGGWVNVSMSSFWEHAPGTGRAEDLEFEMAFTDGFGLEKFGQIGQFLFFGGVVAYGAAA